MNQEEKNKKLFQIYAALGELSVLKKQSLQRLEQINAQTDDFEKQLVELINAEVVEVVEEVPSKE